jgi:hypothetical protein
MDLWLCLTLDERTRSSPLPEYSHIAFNVSAALFEDAAERIRTSGARIWKDNESECAGRPARSMWCESTAMKE